MSTGCAVVLVEDEKTGEELSDVVHERYDTDNIRHAVVDGVEFENANLIVGSEIEESMQPLGNILQVANFAESEWEDEVIAIYCSNDHDSSFLRAAQWAIQESSDSNKFIIESGE